MIIKHAIALSALLVAGTALAQGTPQDPSEKTDKMGASKGVTNDSQWDSLDTNRDGYLTKDELQGTPGLVHNFDRIDSDKDGKISKAEWKAYGHNGNP